jgi:hypothetical protein
MSSIDVNQLSGFLHDIYDEVKEERNSIKKIYQEYQYIEKTDTIMQDEYIKLYLKDGMVQGKLMILTELLDYLAKKKN